jgi:hypothetical protein
MALTDLQYIRLTLNLPHRVILRESLGTGDGASTKFNTQLWPIIAESETVRVGGVVKTRDSDYSIDNDLGLIIFTVAPGDGLAIDTDYKWSVFSDAKIEGLLERYNDQVNPTMRDLVRALIANSDLFIKYTTGMESVDRSKALDALKTLYAELQEEPAGAAAQSVVWVQSDVDTYERDVAWEPFISSTPAD